MSLAQHVTAIEGIDREDFIKDDLETLRSDDGFGTASEGLWRPLSYDPFPENAAPPEEIPALAAYRVSTVWRLAQVAFTVLFCCLASGIVFGFASLKPILVSEGVYGDLCIKENEVTTNGADNVPCAEQDLRLNLFFVAASITTNMSSLLAGFTLDRFGRRVCFIASSIFLALGTLLLGFAFHIDEFDGYVSGNILLGLGGSFLFVPSFQLANAFPKHSGLVVAMVTGAFDASAAIFLFYRLAWEASDQQFTAERFFFGYIIVPVLLHLGEWAIMPAHSYHSTPELEIKIEKAQDVTRDIHDSDEDISTGSELLQVRNRRANRRESKLQRLEELVGNTEEREERAQNVEHQHEASGIWGVLHGLPAHRQMMTPWFVLILWLTVLQMLRMNYFIATIRSQYRYLLDSDEAAKNINTFFDIALPVGGVVATPFIGMLLNTFSVASMLAVLTVYIAAIGVLNCLPYEWAAYATVVAFVLFRPLYYSAVTDYATKVFGFATFGRIYGAITCLSGVVNFAQSGLDRLTHGSLKGDPTPINAFFAVSGTLISLILTLFVIYSGRQYRTEQEKSAPGGDAAMPTERMWLMNSVPEEEREEDESEDEEGGPRIMRSYGAVNEH